jgi:hypothetical protein
MEYRKRHESGKTIRYTGIRIGVRPQTFLGTRNGVNA